MELKIDIDRVQQQQQQQQRDGLRNSRGQEGARASRRGNDARQNRQANRRTDQSTDNRAEQLEQLSIARALQTTRTLPLRSGQAVAVSKLGLYNAGALDRLNDIAVARGDRMRASPSAGASLQDRGAPRKPKVDLNVGNIEPPSIAIQNAQAVQPARRIRKNPWLSDLQEQEYEQLMSLAGSGAEVAELVEQLFQNGYSQSELVAICKALGVDTGGLGEASSLFRLGADLGAAAREPGGYIVYTPSDIRELIDSAKAA